jgi:hypothetical protein
METCVLCDKRFQHYGNMDWGMQNKPESYGVWGQIVQWDGKLDGNFLCCEGNSTSLMIKGVSMMVKLTGSCIGLYYSPSPLPTGSICGQCICKDKRLVHVWSH